MIQHDPDEVARGMIGHTQSYELSRIIKCLSRTFYGRQATGKQNA